ncbi:MAG: competence/damage-inducible protein A [Acidobacteriota bacterium]
MNAEIIAVGSELLGYERQDTNSLFITEKLYALGIPLRLKTIVGDDLESLTGAIRQALERSELLFTTGGLGPTEDDRTREAVAQVLNRRLVLDPTILEDIEAKFRASGLNMPAINSRQAHRFEDCQVYSNPKGTAPGLYLEAAGRHLFLLPGPPREMQPMMETGVTETLRRLVPPRRIFHRRLKISGLSESRVDSLAAPVYQSYEQVRTTILAGPGEILLDFFTHELDEDEATRRLEELVARVREKLGPAVFGSDETLEEVVGRLLIEQGRTLAVAESCTGGGIGERLTRVPGSSRYFLGGVVCYSNDLKEQLVDVPASLIEAHGAVSSEVAAAMAAGIVKRCRASLGLSVTGIAGPDGGTEDKPVGLVFIGLSGSGGTKVERYTFRGDREIIRLRTVQTALDLVRRKLLN